MSKFYGANPAELRALATAMDAEAERLSGWPRQVGRKLDSDIWTGPDADRFRHRWNGQHSSSLREAVKYLKDSAVRLRANADDQEATSADLVGGMPTGPTGPSAPGPQDPAPVPTNPLPTPSPSPGPSPTPQPGAPGPDPFGWWPGFSQAVGSAVTNAPMNMWDDITNVGDSYAQMWNATGGSILAGRWPRFTEVAASTIRSDGATLGAFMTVGTLGLVPANLFDDGVATAGRPHESRVQSGPLNSLRDLSAEMETAYNDPSSIRVTTVTAADGSKNVIVSIPGTETWNPFTSSNPWDLTGNLLTAGGDQSTATEAVRLAMANAGIPPGANVLLVGHSQGGMTAADLASDPNFVSQYNVTNVFTMGSPVDSDHVDPRVSVLSVQHEHDVVPRLDLGDWRFAGGPGDPQGDVGDRRTVTLPDSHAFYNLKDNHTSPGYTSSLAGADDANLSSYTQGLRFQGFLGDGVKSTSVTVPIGRKDW
jgi:hypothetical protein